MHNHYDSCPPGGKSRNQYQQPYYTDATTILKPTPGSRFYKHKSCPHGGFKSCLRLEINIHQCKHANIIAPWNYLALINDQIILSGLQTFTSTIIFYEC